MKAISRFLFGRAQLLKARAKREKNQELRKQKKAKEAEQREQNRRDSVIRAQTYPALRLTQEEYLGIETMSGKPKDFFSTGGLKKLTLGALYKKATPQ